VENHSIENATIELKTLRMATNVTFHEVREAIVSALMNVVISAPAKMRKILEKWGELLSEFTEDKDGEVDALFILQKYFARRVREDGVERKFFVLSLQGFYDVDVLGEESILRWFEEKAKDAGDKWTEDLAALRKSAEKFVTWLREAEEESDE
jgi:translation initiation factor eIF-2B subunit epsilon